MSNIILTDCDGVLVDWRNPFYAWMYERGHTRNTTLVTKHVYEQYGISQEDALQCMIDFNRTADIGFLPPMRDSVKYVRKLHEEYGYVFRVITCLGQNFYSATLRSENLRRLYGSAIDTITFLHITDTKEAALSQYRNSKLFWIEDNAFNAASGVLSGLNSLLMTHDYNVNDTLASGVEKVSTWQEIYNKITGQ